MWFILNIFSWCYSDDDCGNPMVAGYQADVDPDDFTPDIDRIKVIITLNLFNSYKVIIYFYFT